MKVFHGSADFIFEICVIHWENFKGSEVWNLDDSTYGNAYRALVSESIDKWIVSVLKWKVHVSVKMCRSCVTIFKKVFSQRPTPAYFPAFLFKTHFNLCVNQSLVFRVLFCRPLLVFLSFFISPLYCLSFDLWLVITILVFSNFLYNCCSFMREWLFPCIWQN